MPFTVSHVAAVLPAAGRLGRVPAAALVIGSMVPDFPWFFTGGRGARFSHSIAGVLTVDLVVGLFVFVAWRVALQAPLRDLSPGFVGMRLPRPQGITWSEVPWAALGVVLGAFSHILWDAFTHKGRSGVAAVPWLGMEHAGLPGYKWAQYASGLLGAVVVVLWCARTLARTPPDSRDLRAHQAMRVAAWVLVGVATFTGAVVAALVASGGIEVMLVRAATRGGAAGALVAACICGWWWHAQRGTAATSLEE